MAYRYGGRMKRELQPLGQGLPNNRMAGHSAQRGASLVEIMVVLAVLLLGILLAIQVFPLGFGIIRSNGNKSLATRLAEQQMSQLRTDVSNLPQGVLFAFPVGGVLQTITNVDPDNLEQYDIDGNPDTTEEKNPYFSDVNKFRYIKGEGVRVPLPVASDLGTGSVYTCKFGPILMDPVVGNPERAPQNATEKALFDAFLAVVGARMVGRNVEAPGAGVFAPPGFFRNQQSYVIDYGEDENEPCLIAFAPRSANPARTNLIRTFRVTVTYFNGGGIVTASFPIEVSDNTSLPNGAGKWIPLPVSDVVPGSETVVREFDRIPASASWDTTDPYQYKLRSPNIVTGSSGATQPIFANIGVINFNPTGGNYNEESANGTQPFTAYLDYAVLDWHIIKEDREVPNVLTIGSDPNQPRLVPLRTTLTKIKRTGDSEVDATTYNGLYGDENSPVDIQVFNLNDPTGTPLVQGLYTDGVPTPLNADYYIDAEGKGGTYDSGTVYFNVNRLPAGTKVRILYKAVGDWAISFQKAYERYELTGTPFPINGDFDGVARSIPGERPELRFPFSDLGKAFVVTIEYTMNVNGVATVNRLAPIQMTTETEPFPIPNTNPLERFAKVDIIKHLPPNAQADFASANFAGWNVSGSVVGVSVKTRVIWRDADTPTPRWRVQDMDSYLTPKPTTQN